MTCEFTLSSACCFHVQLAQSESHFATAAGADVHVMPMTGRWPDWRMDSSVCAWSTV